MFFFSDITNKDDAEYDEIKEYLPIILWLHQLRRSIPTSWNTSNLDSAFESIDGQAACRSIGPGLPSVITGQCLTVRRTVGSALTQTAW
jgi:hypothetical protein